MIETASTREKRYTVKLYTRSIHSYHMLYLRPGSFVCPGFEIGLVTGVTLNVVSSMLWRVQYKHEPPNQSLKFKALNMACSMCSQVQWNHETPNQSLNCGTLGKRRRLWVYLLYIRYLLIATCNHHKFDLIMQVHRNMCTPVYTCMIHVCFLHTSCVCYPHVMMYILFSVH